MRYNVGNLSVLRENTGGVFQVKFWAHCNWSQIRVFWSSKPSPNGSGKSAKNTFDFLHWRKDCNFLRFPRWSFPNLSNFDPS